LLADAATGSMLLLCELPPPQARETVVKPNAIIAKNFTGSPGC
jgi:hypothetical protein